jgi:hypothetical protein
MKRALHPANLVARIAAYSGLFAVMVVLAYSALR